MWAGNMNLSCQEPFLNELTCSSRASRRDRCDVWLEFDGEERECAVGGMAGGNHHRGWDGFADTVGHVVGLGREKRERMDGVIRMEMRSSCLLDVMAWHECTYMVNIMDWWVLYLLGLAAGGRREEEDVMFQWVRRKVGR